MSTQSLPIIHFGSIQVTPLSINVGNCTQLSALSIFPADYNPLMLIVNKQHHELLIAYYQHELRSLPEGFFSIYRGKKVVYITRDPRDDRISNRNKRRIVISTKDGQIYSKLIRESSRIKTKLNYLNELWNLTYWTPPNKISYPPSKSRTGTLNKERYINSLEMQNPILSSSPLIDYNGRKLRSKNELIVCQNLDVWGYKYKVEIDLSPDEFTPLYPDATFFIPEIDKPVSVEVDGALDKTNYMTKSESRKFNYFNNGFIEFKDVIFLRLTYAYEFSSN